MRQTQSYPTSQRKTDEQTRRPGFALAPLLYNLQNSFSWFTLSKALEASIKHTKMLNYAYYTNLKSPSGQRYPCQCHA